MEQYPTIRLLKTGRNCSSSCARGGRPGPNWAEGNNSLNLANLKYWGAADLLDARIGSPNLSGNTETERFDHAFYKAFATKKEECCAAKQSC